MSNKKTKVMKRRNRNTLTFYEKIAVIRHHETNQLSRNNLARMFQCCTTQIRKILERKDELLAQWKVMSEGNASSAIEEMHRKRREFEMKAAAFILHQWVERCRDLQLNMVINDGTLKVIAMRMATILNIENFKPTGRWIERFRLKFKYKSENLANPRNVLEDPPGTLSVEDIIIEFKNFLPSFMRQEIFNITSNTMEEEGVADGVSPKIEEDDTHHDTMDSQGDSQSEDNQSHKEINTTEHEDVTQHDEMSADEILLQLSTIQRFLLLHSDFKAMAIVESLENHIEERYIIPSKKQTGADTEEVIISIE